MSDWQSSTGRSGRSRRKLALCRKTQNSLPRMEQEIDKAEARESEVRTNEHRRR